MLEVTIPPNTTAEVRIPAADPANVREGWRPLGEIAGLVEPPREENGAVTVGVGSGRYRFTSSFP